jgi:heptosyltransferase-3
MFKNVKKILVIKLRHVGDVLLTAPVIKALKETFPGSSISVLVNSGSENVLEGNPLIDDLIVFDRNIKNLKPLKRYMKEISFFKKIKSKKFDMTVDLTSGDRAAIISLISGAQYRIARDPCGAGFWGKKHMYTHLAQKDVGKHMILQNLGVVRQFNIDTKNLSVDFFVPQEVEIQTKEVLRQKNIKNNDYIVHVHPTSRWLFKCWKDEYMAEVINWLIDKGFKVVVTSAPFDKELKKAKNILSLVSLRITQNPSRLIDLCGKTSIKELAAISKASDLFIGVDSAPMHIAAAVGTPVVALFGPTDESLWGPFGSGHIVISKSLSCKPCTKGSCEGLQLRECMTAIKPDDVIEAIYKITGSKLGSVTWAHMPKFE